MIKTKYLVAVVMTGFACTSVIADNTHIDRYLTVANQATTAQSDSLQQTFQVRFPNKVQTIGDAVEYLLQSTGYSSAIENNSEIQTLLKKPLPLVDRDLGPLVLRDGLLTLVGTPFGLLIDPVHRLVSFRVLPQYQTLFQRSHILF